MKWLEGQVAIITGATRGIGKEIAACFADHGASLAICGTNEALGLQVEQELVQKGVKVKFYPVNIASAEAVNTFIESVLKDFGRVDILVNNAGITKDQLLMKMTTDDWDKVLATNLSSLFYTCKGVIRSMLKARKGKIINISSVIGLMGNAGQTNYAATKSGMIGFSKSLAKESGSRGITVNCIAPGFIKSDMTDSLSEAQKQIIFQQIPLGRLGEPKDVAYAALFLASSMGDYISGQVLTVDGGMVMA